MSENTQSDLISFLSQDTQADTSESDVQSHDDVDNEELDTEDSSTDSDDTDGYDDEEYEDDSTADDEDDDSYDDFDDEDTEESDESKATKFDDEDFEITVDGEKLTVKGSELKSGYMRREAFTKKTQELSEKNKALDAELNVAIQRSEAVKFNAQTELERFDGALKQFGGWDNLSRNATPEEFEQFRNRYIQVQKDANMAEDIYNESINTLRNSNAKKIEVILKDMATRHSNFNGNTLNELNDFLTKRNFTEDMVLGMVSPDAWDMVYEAMLYEKIQSRRADSGKAEKSKSIKNKEHQSVPVKKQAQKSTKSREIQKGLAAQRKAKGAAQSQITRDLLTKILK